MMTILEKLTVLLGPKAQAVRTQETLSCLIEMCQQEATEYCHLLEYDEVLDNIVVSMVLQRYNRLFNEGVASTNASGIRESFTNGYTNDIYNMLRKHRRLETLG